MNLTLIAAIGENNELGLNNHLLWYLPNDLKFFKSNTINKPIVMGINTFKSLPKLLPNRYHIILTHQNIEENEYIKVIHSKEELLNYIDKLNKEVMVIGGAKVYKELLPYSDKMLLTKVESTKEADVFFPKFNKEDWEEMFIDENEDNNIKYKHYCYKRKV